MDIVTNQTPVLAQIVERARAQGYRLPGSPRDMHVVGISGGADSSALAVTLKALFPETEFLFLYTDTGEEVPGTAESIQRIEQYLANPVTQIGRPEGLYGLVESFNGFLPSTKSRYCTRLCKTEPTEDYLELLHERHGVTFHNYVGLRADEPLRTGLESDFDWLQTHFPLRDLGIERREVFAILNETVEIPQFYRHRTRSGCGLCFFMRSSEIIQTLEAHPQVYERAQQLETLNEHDARRYRIDGPDISSLRALFPIPRSIDARFEDHVVSAPIPSLRRKGSADMPGLFADQPVHLFVGVEYFFDKNMTWFGKGARDGTSGCWHQQLVNWSESSAGLMRSLNIHYASRLGAAEAFDMSPEEMQEQYRMAVFHLELPASQVDLDPNTGNSYSWKQDMPLAKLKKTVNGIKRTLYTGHLEQELNTYQGAPEGTWEEEYFEGILRQRAKQRNFGKIIGAYRHEPKPLTPNKQQDGPAPCFVCSK